MCKVCKRATICGTSRRCLGCRTKVNSGLSRVVISLLAIRNTLIMSAAHNSSRWVWRMRPAGFCSVSSGLPLTSGISATPVSKPDKPSASFGKSRRDIPTIANGLAWLVKRALSHSTSTCACVAT